MCIRRKSIVKELGTAAKVSRCRPKNTSREQPTNNLGRDVTFRTGLLFKTRGRRFEEITAASATKNQLALRALSNELHKRTVEIGDECVTTSLLRHVARFSHGLLQALPESPRGTNQWQGVRFTKEVF